MKRVFSLFTASACIAGPAGVTRWLLVNVEEAGVGEPGERPWWWMKIKYLKWQLSQPVACWINISMRSEWSKIIHSVTDEACGWDVSFTGVKFHSMGRGRACSHLSDLDSGHQSIQGGTYHTVAPLCCAGSSVERSKYSSFPCRFWIPWGLRLTASMRSIKRITLNQTNQTKGHR